MYHILLISLVVNLKKTMFLSYFIFTSPAVYNV